MVPRTSPSSPTTTAAASTTTKIFDEWLIVKPLVYAHCHTRTMNQFIAFLNRSSIVVVPKMLVLFKVGSIIPIGNAVSERGVSAMNQIKHKRANSMDSGSDECMTLETRTFLKAHLPSSSDTPDEYTRIIEEATDEYWNGSKKRCPTRALSGVTSGEARRKKAKLNEATQKKKKKKRCWRARRTRRSTTTRRTSRRGAHPYQRLRYLSVRRKTAELDNNTIVGASCAVGPFSASQTS